jgi:hypothetical protein
MSEARSPYRSAQAIAKHDLYGAELQCQVVKHEHLCHLNPTLADRAMASGPGQRGTPSQTRPYSRSRKELTKTGSAPCHHGAFVPPVARARQTPRRSESKLKTAAASPVQRVKTQNRRGGRIFVVRCLAGYNPHPPRGQ